MSGDDTDRDPAAPPVELLVLRAPNPGPMTLTGTNTWVVRDGAQVWVVDPGPKDPEHLADVLLACGAGAQPMGVLVTHHHADHAAGAATLARQLAARSGIPVPLWAADQGAVVGSRPLPSTLEGDQGTVGHVIHLPGHTADSVGLLLQGGRMLTGDTLLGGSSTVIVPEHGGDLGEYLQSLAILRAMTVDGRISSLHPGHGDPYGSPLEALEAIDAAIEHRHQRIEQVRRARTAGILTMDRLLRVVYGAELPAELEKAARWNLRATLDHLAANG